ncbi:MAG: linear amide C-N hydrolase [Gammaproteobacteria bacterium]|jgi:choloylglycine hydrolase|nr:linear amide C-N hydrolase [Gammaproteobacteria bacterium]
MSFFKYIFALHLLTSLLISSSAFACSRIVSNTVGKDILVGRNMDWFEPMQTKLWILPREMKRNGEAGENSLKWTSRFGSIVVSVYDGATAEGMNEKGLTASVLYLSESDFGKRDPKIPGLSLSLWAQYFLDNYESVNEALTDIENNPFQPVMASAGIKEKRQATVHLAITDKSGDTAVIEYIDGKIQIHHGPEFTVMTNSPPYAAQLLNLNKYKGFGGTAPLPGTTEAADRFVRAAYYLKQLPKPKNTVEAVAGVLSVMRNVSQPFGVADSSRPYISETLWRTVADLTSGLFFYESTLSPNIIWVNITQVNFAKEAKTLMLNLDDHPDYIGDVTNKFVPSTMFHFIPGSVGN